ncbi:MAG: hypothetical protein DRI90_28655 [Deltaproteobacteria bacterium]|nr:MAG: hypothetical protein DRI90_28655 [Deltaproteobacteria bacterium]
MDLDNHTPLPAAHVQSGHGDEMLTLLLVCATYDIVDGSLVLSKDQLPLRLAPDPSYANDGEMLRDGVSVCVEGFVYPPQGEAKTAAAELCVGEWSQRITACGARVWWKGALGKLKPTEPRPFSRVEMSWELAFGGTVWRPNMTVEHEGEQLLVPEHDEGYVLNLSGTGFYLDETMALEEPLPQLEDPEHLIRTWDDRPEPVCFAPYPLSGGMRAASLIDDGHPRIERAPRALGRSCPRTTFSEIPAATLLKLDGMRPDGERLSFAVPEPPVSFAVQIGVVEKRLTPQLDAIDVDTEREMVRLVYRTSFRYPIVAFEKRRVTVEPGVELGQSPL